MKQFKIKIYFHSGKSELFGYANDSVECLVSEELKNQIINSLAHDESALKILGIDMQDGGTRYVNMRNVLYIDVREAKDEQNKDK